MHLKIVLSIFFFNFHAVLLENPSSGEITVSTIQSSSNIHEQSEDGLSEVEEENQYFLLDALQNLDARLNQSNNQLQTFSQQVARIQKTLNNLAKHRPTPAFPKHCSELKEKGHNTSGIFTILPEFASEPFLVLCDLNTKGGGWTYILNRFNGNQDFYLGWDEYKNGFGNLANEFWLGLENIHYLTGYEVNELLIELEDWASKEVHAHYALFSIGGENEDYSLKLLGEYSGDAGESLGYHAGMKFTTKDRDHDSRNGENCAHHRLGGWWYKNCVNCNLTGKYMRGEVTEADEFRVMYWRGFRGGNYSLKKARMMVRPTNVHRK